MLETVRLVCFAIFRVLWELSLLDASSVLMPHHLRKGGIREFGKTGGEVKHRTLHLRRRADLCESSAGAQFPHQPAPVGAEFLDWDRCASVRVVGALAVLVLCTRHQKVTPACASDGLHADLERDWVDVCDSQVTEDQGATNGTAQSSESPARPDKPFQVVQVVLLGQEAHATPE